MPPKISIHALRGEGDPNRYKELIHYAISIHALRGEGDVVRGGIHNDERYISIHALRGEGDVPLYPRFPDIF